MPTTLFDSMEANRTSGHDAATEHRLRMTYPGQAHFAGTGPDGMSCRECVFWESCGYYAQSGMKPRSLKPSPCRKWKQLKNTRVDKKVPHMARACRFFEPSSNPPPIVAKVSNY